MMSSSDSLQEGGEGEILVLRQQLMSSLRFHHSDTLEKIPLELAIRAMTEAWKSCHSKDDPRYSSGVSTAVIPREQAAKSIRESKYFSDA